MFTEWPALSAHGEERHLAAACKNPRNHPGQTRGVRDRAQAGEEMVLAIWAAVGLMEQVNAHGPAETSTAQKNSASPAWTPGLASKLLCSLSDPYHPET